MPCQLHARWCVSETLASNVRQKWLIVQRLGVCEGHSEVRHCYHMLTSRLFLECPPPPQPVNSPDWLQVTFHTFAHLNQFLYGTSVGSIAMKNWEDC
jgi:hypothetical protein